MKVKRKFPADATRKGLAKRRANRPSKHNWEVICADYISSEMTRKQTCEKHSVSPRSLDQRFSQEDWSMQRAHFRGKVADRVRDAASDQLVKMKVEALKVVYTLKLAIAQKLATRVRLKGYKPTVTDFNVLQRLEMDLREPGWDKKLTVEHTGGVDVNVFQRTELIIAQIERERNGTTGEVIEVASSAVEDLTTDTFVYGEADDDNDDEEVGTESPK